jgi:predicted RNA-binding protein YlqC (UPF0109 family)
MKDLIEYIAKSLVDSPDDVKVAAEEDRGRIVVRLEVAEDDYGSHRQGGRIAQSMRALLEGGGARGRVRVARDRRLMVAAADNKQQTTDNRCAEQQAAAHANSKQKAAPSARADNRQQTTERRGARHSKQQTANSKDRQPHVVREAVKKKRPGRGAQRARRRRSGSSLQRSASSLSTSQAGAATGDAPHRNRPPRPSRSPSPTGVRAVGRVAAPFGLRRLRCRC